MGSIAGWATRLLGVVAVLAAVWGVAWAGGWVGPPGWPVSFGSRSDADTLPAAELAEAREQLAGIPVKGRAGKGGYERSEFGEAWADVDRNGCDTRNDVLARDLRGVAFREGTRDCVVATGVLEDPYTGARIEFVRGPRSADVQIDHVVPLADAWQKGAQQWTAQRREQFANDPANLLAVDGDANQAKGASDLATWLPQNKGFRCEYTARIVEVKSAYGLWMTDAEHRRAGELLDACRPVG